MNKRIFLILSLLVFASLILWACQPAAPEVASLKVGEMHPFTGPLAEFGEPEHNAALLAAKHLEEAGYKIGEVKVNLRPRRYGSPKYQQKSRILVGFFDLLAVKF